MWNRMWRRLTVKIKSDGNKGIRFSLPILPLLEGLSDTVDLIILIGWVLPMVRITIGKEKAFRLKDLGHWMKVAEYTLDALVTLEPFDLVDIETPDAVVKISIR